jgi:hypothetical protein
MSVRRAPLPAYAPKSPAALVYAALLAEILQRIGESDAPAEGELSWVPERPAAVQAVPAEPAVAAAVPPAAIPQPASTQEPPERAPPPGWPSPPDAIHWRIRPRPEPLKVR